jgi:hypothetical protein
MKKLNEVARSSGIPVKSNNGGIKVEGIVMFVRNVVKKWT